MSACPSSPATALWRIRANRVAYELLERFWDDESGGFFTTGDDAEALIVRPKEYLDGALPATNSIAVHALLRANALDDDERLRNAAERTVSEGRSSAHAPPRGARRHGGGAAHARRPPGDRDHRRPTRPPGRGDAASGSPGPWWPGGMRIRRLSSKGDPKAPPSCAAAFRATHRPSDPPTLREQLEGLPR